MKKLLALVGLTAVLITPALAENFEDLTKQDQTPATRFAKKHTMPGPVVPPLPEPPRFAQPNPKVGSGGFDGGGSLPSVNDVGAANISGLPGPRSTGSISSPQVNARRSLKKLIRSLG